MKETRGYVAHIHRRLMDTMDKGPELSGYPTRKPEPEPFGCTNDGQRFFSDHRTTHLRFSSTCTDGEIGIKKQARVKKASGAVVMSAGDEHIDDEQRFHDGSVQVKDVKSPDDDENDNRMKLKFIQNLLIEKNRMRELRHMDTFALLPTETLNHFYTVLTIQDDDCIVSNIKGWSG
ncbi:hypothetical protein QR680_017099 [Steinernema hermaphroditum]|uniref:Uncharacterized protein n=1 Tax=Steinernema hermaphroditum TaxID=289476 RepID=A0AA39LNI5_9BILA|nr:hypothetical protein QR680_017099 [Steinernema hermaphroditum]